MFELTVCFETGIDEAHSRKMVRYSDLMEMITASSWDGPCHSRSWKSWFPITPSFHHPQTTTTAMQQERVGKVPGRDIMHSNKGHP